MHQRPGLLAVPAWLAMIAVCAWPAFAATHCCCSQASEEFGSQVMGIEANAIVTGTSIGDRATSKSACIQCQTADIPNRLQTGCTAYSATGTFEKTQLAPLSGAICACDLQCCEVNANLSGLVFVTSKTKPVAFFDNVGVSVVHLTDPPLSVTAVEENEWLDCGVLTASARCALLCCWLN